MGSKLDKERPTDDIRTLVLKIVREMSGAAEVAPDSDLVAELGFDSLGLLELLAVLEDAFDLAPIGTEALSKMGCVADLERIVLEAQAGTAPVRTPK